MKKLLDKDLYTIQEVAEYYSVDISTVYRWINNGDMQKVNISERIIRIKKSEIERINAKIREQS